MNTLRVRDDRPVERPEDDAFGYWQFGKDLASVLTSPACASGMVVAVHGPWGSGKSTIAAFVREAFRQLPDGARPAIAEFNPWWFAGGSDLARELIVEVERVARSEKLVDASVADGLRKFALRAAPLARLAAGVVGATVDESILEQDTAVLKQGLAKKLREQDRTLVVMIDDIDRLSGEEIRRVFLAIKALVDFPRIVYLLLFDRDVVEAALSSIQGGTGRDYLEKIVQLSFELPTPDDTALQRFFLARLQAAVGDQPTPHFDQVRWGNLVIEGVQPFITTARRVSRLVNLVGATYPIVAGEVNFIDFVGICTLQTFCPEVFRSLRDEKDFFLGKHQGFSRRDDTGRQKLQAVIDLADPAYRSAVQRLLVRLFPRIECYREGGSHYADGFTVDWRAHCRVCSDNHFPLYFRLALPSQNVSSREIGEVLANSNAQDISALFRRELGVALPNGATRARSWIDQFLHEDRAEHLTPAFAAQLLQALGDVGDDIIRRDHSTETFLQIGIEHNVGALITACLMRIPAAERSGAMVAIIRDGTGLMTTMQAVALDARRSGLLGGTGEERATPTIPTEGIQPVLDALAERIRREAAAPRTFVQYPRLAHILFVWGELSGIEAVRAWCSAQLGTDSVILPLLRAFVTEGTAHTLGDSVGRTTRQVSIESLLRFFDGPTLLRRVVELHGSNGLDGSTVADLQLVSDALS